MLLRSVDRSAYSTYQCHMNGRNITLRRGLLIQQLAHRQARVQGLILTSSMDLATSLATVVTEPAMNIPCTKYIYIYIFFFFFLETFSPILKSCVIFRNKLFSYGE
jgi:hypothetical protein